jgi:hypothetical protein
MRALEGQTLFDIAIQSCGSAEAAFDFAVLNGVSLTDEPTLIDVVPGIIDADIAAYFAKKNIQPATAAGVIPDLVTTPVDSFISYESALNSDEVVVLDGQSFFDLATIYCGSPELAYEFAELNQMPVTAELEAGKVIKKPIVKNKRVAAYYSEKALQPATNVTVINGGGELPIDEGIGYWAIEIDFIIS